MAPRSCGAGDVLGAKKPLIILTFAASNPFEKNADGYEKLLAGIRRPAESGRFQGLRILERTGTTRKMFLTGQNSIV